MKQQHEFGEVASGWVPTIHPLALARDLTSDPDDPAMTTQLTRWLPGYDGSADGVITHDYVEEVYLLEGSLHDLTLQATFHAGDHAYRPPGMPHGPYRSDEGCLMLEIRTRS